MLLGAISQKFDTIVEFSAFNDFISFEKKGKNKVKRVENHKIKVTIEVDMVCGAVWINTKIKKSKFYSCFGNYDNTRPVRY